MKRPQIKFHAYAKLKLLGNSRY